MSLKYDLMIKGPVFDGRLARAVPGFADRAAEDVARHGQDVVWHAMRGSTRTWTNTWGGQLHTENRSEGWVTYSDSVYNAWLEGTGSRNRTSRFKGYRAWRRAQQEVKSKQPDIVARALWASTLGKLMR